MIDHEPRKGIRWWTVNAIRRSDDKHRSYGFTNRVIAEMFRSIQGELIGPPDISALSAHRTTGGDNKEVLYSDAIALPVREILFGIADIDESKEFPTVAMLSAETGFHRRVVERMIAQVIDEEGLFARLQGNETPALSHQIAKQGGVEIGYTPIVAGAVKVIADDLRPISGWNGIKDVQKNRQPHRNLDTWKRGIEVVRRQIPEEDRLKYCRIVITHSGENPSFSPGLVDLAEQAISGGLKDVRMIDGLIAEREEDIIGTGLLSEQIALHPTLPGELVASIMKRFRLSPSRVLARLESITIETGIGMIDTSRLLEAVLSDDFSSVKLPHMRSGNESNYDQRSGMGVSDLDRTLSDVVKPTTLQSEVVHKDKKKHVAKRPPRVVRDVVDPSISKGVRRIINEVNGLVEVSLQDRTGLIAYLVWYDDPDKLDKIAEPVLGLKESDARNLVLKVLNNPNLEHHLTDLIDSLF